MFKCFKNSTAWVTASLALFILLPVAATAQDLPATTLMELDGAPGVWMPMATFRRSVDDLAAGEARAAQLELLTDQLALHRAQLADVIIMRDSAIAETSAVREALDAALRDAIRSRRTAQKARRRMGWTFAAGAVVAVAVGVLVALAAN